MLRNVRLPVPSYQNKKNDYKLLKYEFIYLYRATGYGLVGKS